MRGKECDFEPRVGPENCPTRKFLTKHMGAPFRLSEEGGFKPLRAGLRPGKEESGLSSRVLFLTGRLYMVYCK